MSLTLAARMTFDGAKARQDIRAATTETRGLAAATSEAGSEATRAGTQLAGYDANLARVEAQLRGVTSAQGAQAAAARAAAAGNNIAAGSIGNMAAQFNDIGVMLAAGQNPLQLAIQQGTQISQVLGGQGAAGAVNLLKQGFLSLISPVNLITIGVIAFGAAAVQWLMGAAEAGDSAEEAMERLSEAMRDYGAAADILGADIDELRAKYGALADEVQRAAEQVARNAIQRARADLDAVAGDMRATITGIVRDAEIASQRLGQASALRAGAGQDSAAAQAAEEQAVIFSQMARAAAEELGLTIAQVRALDAAFASLSAAKTMEEIAVNATSALAVLDGLTDTAGFLPAPLAAAYDEITKMRDNAALFEAKVNGATTSARQLQQTSASIAETIARAAGVDLAGVFARAQGSAAGLFGIADRLVGRMQQVARMAQQVGRGNVLVGDAGVFAQGTFQDGGMDAARRGVMNDRPSPFGRPGSGAAGVRVSSSDGGGGGGGGGGASAADAEAGAIQRLITAQERELELLRETDPLKAELIRQRETLAGASEAERAQIEALIETRMREERQLAANKQMTDWLNQSTMNWLGMLADRGTKASDVLRSMLQTLIQAAQQAFVMGQGPLAGILNISGGLFSGGGAAGGGGGTGSLGLPAPFGKRAPAGALRAMIDAGAKVPAFAAGTAADGKVAGGAASVLRVELSEGLRARLLEEAAQQTVEIVQQALRRYDATVLPQSVGRVSRDGRRVG
jgi:hypothetical protein